MWSVGAVRSEDAEDALINAYSDETVEVKHDHETVDIWSFR